jgi:hypothetical protein
VALAIGIPAALSGSPDPATVVALAPVAQSPMAVSVSLEPAAWGTQIAITCDYADGQAAYGASPTYVLVVTDAEGAQSQVASWGAVPGTTVHLSAATAVALNKIASLEVRTSSGAVILSAPVGA